MMDIRVRGTGMCLWGNEEGFQKDFFFDSEKFCLYLFCLSKSNFFLIFPLCSICAIIAKSPTRKTYKSAASNHNVLGIRKQTRDILLSRGILFQFSGS